jgi:hypothetical protein
VTNYFLRIALILGLLSAPVGLPTRLADAQGDTADIPAVLENGEVLCSSFVPASPGNGGLSFFGIVLPEARIARVRITSGNVRPDLTIHRKTTSL